MTKLSTWETMQDTAKVSICKPHRSILETSVRTQEHDSIQSSSTRYREPPLCILWISPTIPTSLSTSNSQRTSMVLGNQ
ncbi:30045191-9ca5-4d48-8155-9cfd64cd73d8 [Sclerotinia trifoliorum]|uniref:30045191-9ca5-4d48-8155-9cfd64cd73d8 n=1 Tax=Sclerotinia trifoliorum TaxID=28548 RepID=A0A8H2ZPF3_9HELO|nr:30045191-9ca5-4d48-8155-9cfd64cd73d8 [Sclerotinia trifoliorum]